MCKKMFVSYDWLKIQQGTWIRQGERAAEYLRKNGLLFVINGGMLLFTYLAAGLACAAQVERRRACRQLAVVGIVFAYTNVVVLAQTDVTGRGPVS
jgi:hypothetical protein